MSKNIIPLSTREFTTVTQKVGLDIYKTPSLFSKKIGHIPYKETVSIVAKSDSWYQISYDNILGYIQKNKLVFNTTHK